MTKCVKIHTRVAF